MDRSHATAPVPADGGHQSEFAKTIGSHNTRRPVDTLVWEYYNFLTPFGQEFWLLQEKSP
jgi:hypothetical protein